MNPSEAQPFMAPPPPTGLTYSWQNLRAQVPISRQSGFASCFTQCPPRCGRNREPIVDQGSEALNGGLVRDDQASKVVLDDVSGIVEKGDLCAILGASGAGKSTLLNALTMRNVDALEVYIQGIKMKGLTIDKSHHLGGAVGVLLISRDL